MRGVAVVALAALAAGACVREGGNRAEVPVDTTSESAAGAGGYRPPSLRLSPAAGPPGSEVALALGGLVMNGAVEVGFGDLGEHVILGEAKADASGELSTTVTVPADASMGPHFFFVSEAGTGQPVSTPTVFLVSGANGEVTVSGRMTDEGVECPAMRGEAGELYTLASETELPAAGTQVTVVGTLAEISTCQQGTTLAVESVTAR